MIWTICSTSSRIASVCESFRTTMTGKCESMDIPARNDELIQLYNSATDFGKDQILVALGDAQGDVGIQLLQEVLRDRSVPSDRRCAAVVAVTKRIGVEASGALLACVRQGDKNLQQYAVHGLAV